MTTRRVRDAAISLGEVHCEARAGLEAAPIANEARKIASLVMCSIQFVRVPRTQYEFGEPISRMLLRRSGCACPNVIREPVGWLARVPWMDGCGTTFATTPYKKGGYGSATVIVSNSPALFPRRRGLDTRPAKRLSSRDAPEFAPLNGCDADGSLEPTAYRLGAIAMTVLGALWS